MSFTRPEADLIQDLASAAYGSPLNPSTETSSGDIVLVNPHDGKELARIKEGSPVKIESIIWKEGVKHDDTKLPQPGFRGWNQYTNSTEVEHKATPESEGQVENPETPVEVTPEPETPEPETPEPETPVGVSDSHTEGFEEDIAVPGSEPGDEVPEDLVVDTKAKKK